jgi:hypothetical protein
MDSNIDPKRCDDNLLHDKEIVPTSALGSRPRQGVARLRAKKETRDSLHITLGSAKSVRE